MVQKGRVWLGIGFAQWSAYRFMILVWMLAGTIPLIMLAVWIGKAQANNGSLGGYTPAQFADYFLAAWISQHLVIAWVSWELDWKIRSGDLSARLLRPFHPFWENLLLHSAEKFVRVPLMIIVLIAGVLLIPGARIIHNITDLFSYLVVIYLAFIIRFLVSYCIGLLAFWLDQSLSLEEFYNVVAMFTSGVFAPLDLYPAPIRSIIEWTPFPYLLYYPVRILTGNLSAAETVRVVLVQSVWVVILGLLGVILWKRGLRRYGAVGS
jgi:ABC-2 type transport system permease protein